MKIKLASFIALSLVVLSAPLFAHHGTSVTYQVDKTITISGTVTEFSFSYPHPQLYLDVKDANGNITAVHCEYFPDSKSGTPGSANYKVKGNIHWVNAADAVQAEVRLYDRLFTDATPDAGGKDFMTLLNPNSLEVIQAYVEPGMAKVEPDTRLQFERHGYFVTDRKDSVAGKPVFNRITTLKDSFGK